MPNYKVVIIIKQEEKKIHLAVSQEDEELVKFESLSIEDSIDKRIQNIINAYPAELEEFKKKEVKTSPVKLKKKEKEEKKAEKVETPKEEKKEEKTAKAEVKEESKQDLFEASKEQEQPTEGVPEDDADLMDMMEE